jgi:hypothetical protein
VLRKTITRLTVDANYAQAGLVRIGSGPEAAGTPTVELWRTAALSRARRVMRPGEDLAAVVDQVHGAIWVDDERFILTDLSTLSLEELASPPLVDADRTVTVAGVRSLIKAAVLVARLAVENARRRLTRAAR